MKRRDFMISAGALSAGLALLPRAAQAAPGTIDWFTSSDQNVLDFWTNVVKPKFEAANPGVVLNLVDEAGETSGFGPADHLAALVEHDWLVPGALVIVERSGRSPEPTWPRGLDGARAKRYGETTLWYAEAVSSTP